MNMVTQSKFAPSRYQQAVFDWVVNGNGHGVIKAVPGSGKSTTLLQASLLLKTNNAVFLAFNKSIETELSGKLADMGSMMRAQTINAFGYSALRSTGKKYKLESNKYHGICKSYLESRSIDGDSAYEYKRLQKLKKMCSLARMTLVEVSDQEAISKMCQHYDIELEPEEWAVMWRGIKACLQTGESLAKLQCIIDFDDQVYLPVIWGLTPEKKDWIFCDESQDLNAARLELIIRSVNGTGRLLFVGDENQSIYGFSGADTQSMNKIIERTHATVMPLSICYRCPSSHVELCASIIPGLEASSNAPQGIIEHIRLEAFYDKVQPGDLVLCRLNAPLVKTCLDLIQNGVRAKVRGSDIGVNFVNTLKKIHKNHPYMNITNLIDYVSNYRDEQAILIGVGDDSEMKIAALDDRVDTMKALYYGYCEQTKELSMEDFYTYIENFFSDERGPLVILSTIHKAKGLEENRVFILEPEKMPHPKAKQGWQLEQEMNIKYVAFSRAKFDKDHPGELYLVSDLTPPVQVEETEEKIETVTPIIEELPAILTSPVILIEDKGSLPNGLPRKRRAGGGRKRKEDLAQKNVKLGKEQIEWIEENFSDCSAFLREAVEYWRSNHQ